MRERDEIDDKEIVPLQDRAADTINIYKYGEPIMQIKLDNRESILRGIAYIEMELHEEHSADDMKSLQLARNELHVRYESLRLVKREEN